MLTANVHFKLTFLNDIVSLRHNAHYRCSFIQYIISLLQMVLNLTKSIYTFCTHILHFVHTFYNVH